MVRFSVLLRYCRMTCMRDLKSRDVHDSYSRQR